MEPYSAWADWLNKFHTASETIQALWIVASAVTVIGVTWVVTRGVVEVVRVWRGGGGARGRLVYGVIEKRVELVENKARLKGVTHGHLSSETVPIATLRHLD